jgi:hypothetical protein
MEEVTNRSLSSVEIDVIVVGKVRVVYETAVTKYVDVVAGMVTGGRVVVLKTTLTLMEGMVVRKVLISVR